MVRRVADELVSNTGKKKEKHDDISDDAIYGMMYEACGDKNGSINIEQFLRIMKKGKLF